MFKAFPGKPPKNYGKKYKRAIGLFVNKGTYCIEQVRGIISRRGDVYILPLPPDLTRGKLDLHESFHVSGEFHWSGDLGKVYPVCGIYDAPVSVRFKIILDGPPLCLCLRCGKKLKVNEIERILIFLVRYIPFNLNTDDIKDIANELHSRGFFRLTLQDLAILERKLLNIQNQSAKSYKLVKWNDMQSIEKILRDWDYGYKYEEHREVVKRLKKILK